MDRLRLGRQRIGALLLGAEALRAVQHNLVDRYAAARPVAGTRFLLEEYEIS
jgi:hypothetical protein